LAYLNKGRNTQENRCKTAVGHIRLSDTKPSLERT
jgi:hypothetical protein